MENYVSYKKILKVLYSNTLFKNKFQHSCLYVKKTMITIELSDRAYISDD